MVFQPIYESLLLFRRESLRVRPGAMPRYAESVVPPFQPTTSLAELYNHLDNQDDTLYCVGFQSSTGIFFNHALNGFRGDILEGPEPWKQLSLDDKGISGKRRCFHLLRLFRFPDTANFLEQNLFHDYLLEIYSLVISFNLNAIISNKL